MLDDLGHVTMPNPVLEVHAGCQNTCSASEQVGRPSGAFKGV
jgi:hypothetical protein